MNVRIILALLFFLVTGKAISQTDSSKLFRNDQPEKEYVETPFKSTRVIMSHSIQMLKPGVLDFRILHRFGEINGGFYQAFGLDGPATIRLGLDYGINKDLTIGIGHATYKKELDGFLKYRLLQQSTGPNSMPFSLVVAGGLTVIRDTNYKKTFNSG